MKNLGLKISIATLLALAVPSIVSLGARADRDDVTAFRARLTGFGEVPPQLEDGTGTFVGNLSDDGQSISWTLTWTGLTGPAQVAHVHFGPPQNVGTPVVFFCGGPAGPNAKPACPDGPGHSASITGTWTASDVQAVQPQGVAAGDFAGLLKILRAHLGYANIHTPNHLGGEIRGQVRVRRGEDDDSQ